MKTKKNRKYSEDLVLGDVVKIAGMRCTVINVESVFHYRPDAFIRIELRSDDYLGKGKDVTLFLGRGVKVKTEK